MAKINDDNKTLKEKSKIILVEKITEMAKNYLTALEYEILTGVLVQSKTFKEIGDKRLLTNGRVKAIFEIALARQLIFLENLSKADGENYVLKSKNAALEEESERIKLRDNKLSKLSKTTQELLQKRVSDLDLSTRVKNTCSENGITFLFELVKLNPREIKKYRNCGNGTVIEIEAFFANHGLNWDMDFF